MELSKLHAPGLCLHLPPANVGVPVPRRKGPHPQKNVTEKSSRQDFASACVRRQILRYNVNASLLSEDALLLQYLVIFPPQTVIALDRGF